MKTRQTQLTRRQLLRYTALGAGSLMLGPWDSVFGATQSQNPAANQTSKYFLTLVLQGAADASYMWDARPLAMTAAGKIQNWWTKGDEPVPYVGVNGQTSLRTPLVEPLLKFRDRMTVLNGVHMSATFDGHLQNMNFLFCGSAFGGESFVPHLNLQETGQTPASLDAIAPAGGGPNVDGTNLSRVVPLEPKSIAPLGVSLQQVPPLQTSGSLNEFIMSRLKAIGDLDPEGRFSKGTRTMLDGIVRSPVIHGKLKALVPPNPQDSLEKQVASLISQSFKLNISRSAIYGLPEQFDVHTPNAAQGSARMFQSALAKSAELLTGLAETPYDENRSILDVTTVLIVSEMSRTMRVDGQRLEESGTNHNPFGNSVVLLGQGIKPGQVFGSSDFVSATETLSKAHLSIDSRQEKIFGRPFDFSNSKSRSDLPEKYDPRDYLTIGSVINSLYDYFGVPVKYHRNLGAGLPNAPFIKGVFS